MPAVLPCRRLSICASSRSSEDSERTVIFGNDKMGMASEMKPGFHIRNGALPSTLQIRVFIYTSSSDGGLSTITAVERRPAVFGRAYDRFYLPATPTRSAPTYQGRNSSSPIAASISSRVTSAFAASTTDLVDFRYVSPDGIGTLPRHNTASGYGLIHLMK